MVSVTQLHVVCCYVPSVPVALEMYHANTLSYVSDGAQ